MNDNWEGYQCFVDEMKALMVFNLELAADPPMLEMPVLANIVLIVDDPDADGFPDEEENHELIQVEDTLIGRLSDGETAVCAGHCVCDGNIDLYFYVTEKERTNFARRVEKVMDDFPRTEWDIAVHDDPEWEVYFDFLSPDPQGLVEIYTRRRLDELEQLNDDLTAARRVDHLASFTDRDASDRFMASLTVLGYSEIGLVSGATPDHAAENERLLVSFSRADAPERFMEIAASLSQLADTNGGIYLGWNCLPA
jgi:uncharacterized protein (TIGR01619 family)